MDIEDVQRPIPYGSSTQVRMVESGAAIGVENDRRHSRFLLLGPADFPRCAQPAVCGSLKSPIDEFSRIEEQVRVYLAERLTCDGGQQVDFLCETSFFVMAAD